MFLLVIFAVLLQLSVALRTPMGGARIRRPASSKHANYTVPKPSASGVFGIDVSDPNIDSANWACMHTQGNYDFAVVEGCRDYSLFSSL
jgi:hypothetical protein